MATQADLIFAEIMNNKQPLEGDLPVIFIGSKPRWLGIASDFADADRLLFLSRLSATYISKAEVKGMRCILAHG